MDLTFIEGVAATLAAIIVFVGSVFLLLTMVTGSKLAYFITASVTLGFMVIMGLVWSYAPLGPVGELPDWEIAAVAAEPRSLDIPSAGQFPDEPFTAPADEGEEAQAGAAALQSAAEEALGDAIEAGDVRAFEAAEEAAVDPEATRLLETDDGLFGVVVFEPAEGSDATGEVAVAMEFDPGNPLGQARMITLGSILLFGLHLFGLGRAEREARERESQEESG